MEHSEKGEKMSDDRSYVVFQRKYLLASDGGVKPQLGTEEILRVGLTRTEAVSMMVECRISNRNQRSDSGEIVGFGMLRVILDPETPVSISLPFLTGLGKDDTVVINGI